MNTQEFHEIIGRVTKAELDRAEDDGEIKDLLWATWPAERKDCVSEVPRGVVDDAIREAFRRGREGLRQQAEPTRAIYYVPMFRDFQGQPRTASDRLYAEQKHAEMYIELRKAEGMKTDYFIGTLSVPVSEVER